ncbi:protein phosphatase 1 regulatory subunit 1C isoform 2-T2 [Aulostomus maculatus]
MEPSSPKKIQFAVPPLQGQLDPQAAEHIRRRRPTPATLQIYRQPGTDAGDQNKASGESQASDPSQRKQSTYAPPTMKGKLENSVPEEDEEEVNRQSDS